MRLRPATVDDAPRLAAVMAEGLATYRAFGGTGFSPPSIEVIEADLAARLPQPSVWCRLAEQDGAVAGYVSLLPAAEARRRVDDPRLAHFWMLFVRPPWWGTGLARQLHGDACEAAAARGFTAMRLFAAAGQARARRFYEREGWALVGEPFPHDLMGLDMVEYRRAVSA